MRPTPADAPDQAMTVRQRVEALVREMRAAEPDPTTDWAGPRHTRALRRLAGWTQTDLADRLNEAVGGKYRQTDVSQYERGMRPNIPLLRDLTRFFNTLV